MAFACAVALTAFAASGVNAQVVTGAATGSNGANGGFGVTRGGTGGTGTAALQTTAGTVLSIQATGSVTGGNGGNGGIGIVTGGTGGAGGTGVIGGAVDADVQNAGAISGGNGGTGGSAVARGAGGAGGTGAALTAPVTLTNTGTISGGAGGAAGALVTGTPTVAAGGVGVTATGGATVVNDGTLRGGLSGDGATRADAVRFSGGGNRLELRANSVVDGNVVATAAGGDTLALGGSTSATLDTGAIGAAAQYRNFTGYEKVGASTWTLTGITTAVTPWSVRQGALSIADDASLGANSGALTLDGGTLQTTADITATRAIALGTGNGTLATAASTTYTVDGVVSGTGGLTKTGSGTTVLNGTNTYEGGTTVTAGTLVGDAGSFGSGAIANNASLVIDQATNGTLNNALSGAGSFTKTGAGDLQLAGATNLTGGAAVNGGELQLGNSGNASGVITGTRGTNGAAGLGNGGNATGGATGVLLTGAATGLDNFGTITGGAGGTGGIGVFGTGGSGGAGAVGVTSSVTGADITNAGTISGGAGGQGGSALVRGAGGAGGAGTTLATGSTLTNTGTIAGGAGGAAGALLTGTPTVAAGGVGVVAAGGDTIVNDGTIRGGLSGNGATRANAITLTGGGNRLELLSNSAIQGNVVATAAGGDTLALTGSSNAIFNAALIGDTAQYRNFTGFEKLGTSTWTLTGSTTALTPWSIDAGTLSIATDASLGASAGTLTIDGGTLRTTADLTSARAVTAGAAGATVQTDAATTAVFNGAVSGSGALDKTGTGTLVLANANTYTGGTTITAGTLQLGNGGTSGSIAGNVANSGTLAFDRSDAALFAGVVSGTGSVEQRGTGATVLTGTNTYSGGTTVAAGTLQLGNGGTTGSIAGDVVDNGTLAFNRSDAVTFAGVVSGTGTLEQRGTGTTTLTGTNTYTGGTTIAAGTLQLGNGGTTGSITGNVANSGTLAFDRSDAVRFNGTISGTGTVVQSGTGSTTLAAANSYSGGTTVTAGTLIGNSGSFGSGSITDNAALVLDQSASGSMANVLLGTGQITKQGSGSLNLTGNSSAFAGNTVISAGTLAVNGTLGGLLTVADGGTLKGTGTVGSTLVQSGGTVAPGNSIGTLNVAGNIIFAAGSTYQVEAAGDGRSDQIRATGTATLQGGTVSVLATGTWQPTTSYTIIAANGGVLGRFSGATTDMAFLEPFLTYGPQTVTLRLQRNDVNFADVAQTRNQIAAAGAVAALHTGTLYSAVVQLNAADARAAFDSLSGEVHASVKSTAIEDSRFVRDAGLTRLRQSSDQPDGNRGGLWAHGFGAWGDTAGDGNASSTTRSTSGILIGADTRVGDAWNVGVLGGYSRNRVTLDNRASSASSDTYHAGVYGGTQWGALGLRLGAAYSVGDTDTERNVAFTGFSDSTRASYDLKTAQVFGELGWRIPTATGALEPFVGLAHVNLRTDGFSESGGIAALTAGKSTDNTTFSTLGLRGVTTVDMGTQTTLKGLLGWRHAFGDTDMTRTVALAGQPGFTVAGVPIAKNTLVVEGGIDVAFRPNLTLGLSYVGQVGSGVTDRGVKADLLWKF